MSGWNDHDLGQAYDWVEFTLTDGQTNYDVRANQAAMFSNINIATKVVIETTRNITARLNSTSFPAIKIDAGASPVELKGLIDVKNIYLSNASGASATIRILLV